MSIYRLDLIQLPGPAYISQITNQSWNFGVETERGYGSGNVHPLFSGVMSQRPTVDFTTSMLATLLAQVPFIGAGISASSAIHWKKAATTGNETRDQLTDVHVLATLTLGYVHWNRIQLNQDSPGTADCVITVGYDGTNEPLVPAAASPLPSNVTDVERYVVGPVFINGSQLSADMIQSATIETGIELDILSGDGQPWPTEIALRTTNPVITVETREVSTITTTGVDGVALDGANGIVVYGRKLTANQAGGVARVAKATTQHLSFTGLNGHYWVETQQADGNTPARSTIRAELTAADDTTVPVTTATNATIP